MPIADFVKKVQERKYHLDDRQRALDGSRAESHIVSVTVFVRLTRHSPGAIHFDKLINKKVKR